MAIRTSKVTFAGADGGNRKRLRQRLMTADGVALTDDELLELLLPMARPQREIKPLARRLLKRFGSVAGVLSTDPVALAEMDGMAEASVVHLKAVQVAAVRLAREEAMERPVIESWRKVLAYCRANIGHNKVEQMWLLFLDGKNVLITDELHQTGTVDHVSVYPREVIKRALEVDASAIIMVHNHPSGDPTPSRDDIEMTREINEAAEKLGISLYDHIIITRGSCASFKSMGLL